jgi:hypothetical protein
VDENPRIVNAPYLPRTSEDVIRSLLVAVAQYGLVLECSDGTTIRVRLASADEPAAPDQPKKVSW